jgi:hypothetical protein
MKRVRFAALVIPILLIAPSAAAQTPFATEQVARKPAGSGQVRGASAANSWMGAQLGYKFGNNSDELGDNLLVSAAVIYKIPLNDDRKWVLPVISNFSDLVSSSGAETAADKSADKLKELMMASSGIRAGVHPYRVIAGGAQGSDYTLLLHGEASWKFNGVKNEDSEEINYLNQLRLAGGLEVSIGTGEGDSKPLTLSVTPVHVRFNADEYEEIFSDRKSSLTNLEVVAVVPISGRTGVLFEYVGGDVRSFRAGVIIAGEK